MPKKTWVAIIEKDFCSSEWLCCCPVHFKFTFPVLRCEKVTFTFEPHWSKTVQQVCHCNFFFKNYSYLRDFPGSTSGKEPTCQCRRLKDVGLIPGPGRSSGGGHGNPLQYSCLENPMDRGAWWTTVRRVTESDMTEVTSHACTHIATWM